MTQNLRKKLGIGALALALGLPVFGGSYIAVHNHNQAKRTQEYTRIQKLPVEQRTLEEQAFLAEVNGFWSPTRTALKNHPELNPKMTQKQAEEKGYDKVISGEWAYSNAKACNQRESMEKYKEYSTPRDLSK